MAFDLFYPFFARWRGKADVRDSTQASRKTRDPVLTRRFKGLLNHEMHEGFPDEGKVFILANILAIGSIIGRN